MRLYAKALRSLQDAISSETGCMDAEILCATRELNCVPWIFSSLIQLLSRALKLTRGEW